MQNTNHIVVVFEGTSRQFVATMFRRDGLLARVMTANEEVFTVVADQCRIIDAAELERLRAAA